MTALPSINALLLTLPNLGWSRLDANYADAEIWVPGPAAQLSEEASKSDENAIFVPKNTGAPDFAFNMKRVISSLLRASTANVIEQLTVAEYRVSHQMDEFELRSNTSSQSGILPWQEGVNLINGARAILDASARASHRPNRHFANQSSTIASNFLDGCYMGQTRVGSYIVTALIPATQEFSTTTSRNKKSNSSLSGRTISQTMFDSLRIAQEATDHYREDQDPGVFELYVSQGLSCELFSGIDEVIGEDETEMSIEFLPLAHDGTFDLQRETIVFDQNHKDAVKMGIEALSKKPGSRDTRIAGEVTLLSSKVGNPDSTYIRLRSLSEKGSKSYNVRLTKDQYEVAVEAHSRQMQLEITGKVTQSTFTEVESVYLTDSPVSEENAPVQDDQPELFE